MRLKLDENLGRSRVALLERAGHDVAAIYGEQLTSAPDEAVLAACKREKRGLVTLDLDFSNPLRYRPGEQEGIAVIRLPRRCSHGHLEAAVAALEEGLATRPLSGKLWVVQPGLIREYQEERSLE